MSSQSPSSQSPSSSQSSSAQSSSSQSPSSQRLSLSPSPCLQKSSSSASMSPPSQRRPFFFLHYLWSNESSVVYDPFPDRWYCLSVPRFPTASSGSHLLITSDSFYDYRRRVLHDMVSSFHLFNPFSKLVTTIPLPPLLQPSHGSSLAFDDNNNHVVVAYTESASTFQIYDSRQGSWTSRAIHPPVFLRYIVNFLFLDGLMYVLSEQPARLTIVNLGTDEASRVPIVGPSITFRHLMAFDGRFFLVGFAAGQKNASHSVGIRVWEFFLNEIFSCRLVCSMPPHLLREFCQGSDVSCLQVSSGAGMICFFHTVSHRLVMYDLMAGRWRMASRGPFAYQGAVWLGVALEPTPDVIRLYDDLCGG